MPKDFFDLLALPRALVIDDEQLGRGFREQGKRVHPDAGGDSEEFRQLQLAKETLSNPAGRLKHWLELEGFEGGLRGEVSGDLMQVFAKVGDGLQSADELARRRDGAGSALAKAMLEREVQTCREDLEALQQQLGKMVALRVAEFEKIENGELDGWPVARDLAFLSKWEAEVRARFGALW